jgi:hypothetical protein
MKTIEVKAKTGAIKATWTRESVTNSQETCF